MGSRQWVSFIADCKLNVSFVDSEHLFKESVHHAQDIEHWMQLKRLYQSSNDLENNKKVGAVTSSGGNYRSGAMKGVSQTWGSNNGVNNTSHDDRGFPTNPKNYEGEMGFDAFLEGIVRTAVKVYRTNDFGFAVRKFLYDKVFPAAQRLENNHSFDRSFYHSRCQEIVVKNRRNLNRVFMLACPKRWTRYISPARWVDFLKVSGMIGNTLTLARALSFFILANGGPEAPRYMRFKAFTNGFARCAAERQRLNLDIQSGDDANAEQLGKAIVHAIHHVLSKERELDL